MCSKTNALGVKRIIIILVLIFGLVSCGNTEKQEKIVVDKKVAIDRDEKYINEKTIEKEDISKINGNIIMPKNFNDGKGIKIKDNSYYCQGDELRNITVSKKMIFLKHYSGMLAPKYIAVDGKNIYLISIAFLNCPNCGSICESQNITNYKNVREQVGDYITKMYCPKNLKESFKDGEIYLNRNGKKVEYTPSLKIIFEKVCKEKISSDSKREKDITDLFSAIEMFYQDNGEYPKKENFLKNIKIYLNPIPKDIKKGQIINGCEFGYKYEVGDDLNGIKYGAYKISSCLENGGIIEKGNLQNKNIKESFFINNLSNKGVDIRKIGKKEICKKISMCEKEEDLIDDGEKWKICIHTPGTKSFPTGQTDCYFFDKKTLKQLDIFESTN